MMKGLGAKTDFCYIEGGGHIDLYSVGDDSWGLCKAIAWEMYAVARPGSKPRCVVAAVHDHRGDRARVGDVNEWIRSGHDEIRDKW
jgi:hypothetical protein